MRARREIFTRIWRSSPRTWIFLTIALLAICGFLEVVDDVFFDPAEGDRETPVFDARIFAYFRGFRGEALTQAMVDWTALGSASVLTVACLAVLAVFAAMRDFRGMLYVAIAGLGAAFWPWFLKPRFGRARPDLTEHLVRVGDLSFPSGHSFGAAAVYLALAVAVGRHFPDRARVGIVYAAAAVLVAGVGASRIYLGVHFFSDVVAGVCAGAAWASLLAAGLAYAERARASGRLREA